MRIFRFKNGPVGKTVAMLALLSMLLASAPSWASNPAAPPSLKTVPIPEPNNLGLFLKSNPAVLNQAGFPTADPAAKSAAIALGKALFWDMQVGSDSVQSCASCHFHAGADNRAKNQVSPGLNGGDTTFQVVGPNGTLTPAMFPFTKFLNPEDRFSQLLSDMNDVVSSQGVHNTSYVGLPVRGAIEQGSVVADPVFNVNGTNVRRVEPRNAPTVINAVYNFANFWDGRASNIFNGSNPFGDSDPNAGVWVPAANGSLVKQQVRIPMASLASQAVGPPGSPFEMSFAGRSFPAIGKKLLTLVPLGLQQVHPSDSVLGSMVLSTVRQGGRGKLRNGLNTSYGAMIRAAFQDKYWNSTQAVLIGPDRYTQMEANFALFFGLAVQLYEATLVSDDSPFDRFQEGDDAAMSASAQAGLLTFLTQNDLGVVGGSCINCHGTSSFTNASVMHIGATNFGASLPETLLENMIMGDSGGAFYDAGFYNIGVRPTDEDLGRGGKDPFGYPLSFTDRALLLDNGGTLPFDNPLLACVVKPCLNQRSATGASFKTPTLRNIELTGPYFHTGGAATLMQVLDHYTRGGSFHERNLANLAPDIETLFGLQGNLTAQNQLIDFMLSLTDDRVRMEKAPFDHPELFVPNGASGGTSKVAVCKRGQACDTLLRIPAVGKGGLAAEGWPAIVPFLSLDPHQP